MPHALGCPKIEGYKLAELEGHAFNYLKWGHTNNFSSLIQFIGSNGACGDFWGDFLRNIFTAKKAPPLRIRNATSGGLPLVSYIGCISLQNKFIVFLSRFKFSPRQNTVS